MNESAKKRLQVFINKCLRQILGIRWFDLVTTEDLLTRTNEQRVEEQKKDVGDGAGLDTPFEDLTQTLQKGL